MQERYQIYQQDLKQRGVRVQDDATAIQPGEFKDVDTPGGNLKDVSYSYLIKNPHRLYTVDGDCSSSRTEIRINC
jgi:hypothetical protein